MAELLQQRRPVLLDLANRVDLRQSARHWESRVATCAATSERPPPEALLIRPDGYVACAPPTAEQLREGLSQWVGTPGAS